MGTAQPNNVRTARNQEDNQDKNYFEKSLMSSVLDIDFRKDIKTILASNIYTKRIYGNFSLKLPGKEYYSHSSFITAEKVFNIIKQSTKAYSIKGYDENLMSQVGIPVYIMLDKFTLMRYMIIDSITSISTSYIEVYFIGLNHKKWAVKMDKILVSYSEKRDMEEREAHRHNAYISIFDDPYNGDRHSIQAPHINKIFFEGKDILVNNIKLLKERWKVSAEFNLFPKYSILLYGNPGTGKTSFAHAIARAMRRSVCILKDKRSMQAFLGSNFCNTIILMDEIDLILESLMNSNTTDFASSAVDKAGALQFLLTWFDRIGDNNILIATTNHKENLPDALYRPGRFNVVMEVKPASREIAEKMCRAHGVEPSEILTDDFPLLDGGYQQALIEQKLVEYKYEKILKSKEE